MAYDEGLTRRIRDILAGETGLVEKKMFGGVGFMLDGNMACGVNKDDLIVRVGPDNYERLVMQPHARPFDLTGRPMKGWLMVTAVGVESEAALRRWLADGVSFARTLPPK